MSKALPEWDLSDFYTDISDKSIKKDLSTLRSTITNFAESHQSRLAALSGDDLAEAIARYESIQEMAGKLGSYAQLCFAKDTESPEIVQFYQNIHESLSELLTAVLFFTIELNTISDEAMQAKLASKKLAHYTPWIRDIRAMKPYQLNQELETLLHEKSITGASSWVRLFDQTMTGLRFPFGKKELTEAEAFDLMSSKKEEKRKEAALVIGNVLSDNAKTFALITNTLAKDKAIEDKWRGFSKPISSRNVANLIEDEVVEALLTAVQSRYADLSHRYYALKASWFGKKKLEFWDRNAPNPFALDTKYSWNESKKLVLDAYAAFSGTLADTGKTFFEKPWIDAPVKKGKSSGAFAHPCVPSVHPYLLVNFQGKPRDVMTLAHELGHGVHQVLAAKQGALMADTPLTLAETASVFGEQLTFRAMLEKEKNPKQRKALLASKVEDMINTVVRQVAFCQYEILIHDARKNGELTVDQISDIWMQVQRDSLGPAIKLKDSYQYFWTYIPHFIHSPFYVYAYAFGDCLVNSLYAAYLKEKEAGNAAVFEKKYITMLEAGGTLRHKELLAPFGLDASKPDFWNQGLDIIANMITELETI